MKRILNYAEFYNLYQNLIGCQKYLKKYCEDFIMGGGKNALKVLDYGCGIGSIIKFLPSSCKYLGIDISQNYINYAKRKYPEFNFICKDLSKKIDINEKFDIVICEAVLSSISDKDTENVFSNILNCTTKESKIIISDMNYSSQNSNILNFLLRNERGNQLRDKEDYTKLISKYFKIDKITILNDIYYIPYSKIVLECSHNM